MQQRHPGGRRSKGDRDQIVTRYPRAVGDAIRQRWADEGYDSIGDYIAAVMARHEGMAELAPSPHPTIGQEVLQIPA